MDKPSGTARSEVSFERENHLGQPIGAELPGWKPRQRPDKSPMQGRFCRVEALDPGRHATGLFESFAADPDGAIWTYIPFGPFRSQQDLEVWASDASRDDDVPYFAILDQPSGRPVGIASFMRIKPEHGVLEVGGIVYSPLLQRKPAATEAMFLMMRRAFRDLGYRRYEWKCDALNAASRRAAARLGFSYDGLFEQVVIYKGRNRDTTWFSILDRDWPMLERAYDAWLSPENFDASGEQIRKLGDLIASARAAT
ncbi:GNAT family N-acetyltransferase [Primorskyibacter sp. S87]|uniref:GNAT family N-acetyltransferase n=1 Tax=Primorskyibacter sp. S87 TaxID=3415126 RepID=UPI003C7D922E